MCARLLGVELLTLDATVVLGRPEALAGRRSAPIPATGNWSTPCACSRRAING